MTSAAPFHMALTDNIILCLDMLEGTGTSIADLTGNGHNGTLSGGYSWTTGPDGLPAIDMDGTNGTRIAVAHHSNLNVATISWACWVNLDGWGQLTTLVSKQSSSSPFPPGDIRRLNAASTTQWQATCAVGGTNYQVVGPASPTVTTGVWQLAGLTYDGEELRAWLNGVSGTANATPSGNLQTSSIDLWIGGNPSFTDRHVDGKFQQFAMWNRALSADEWSRLYNGGTRLPFSMWSLPKRAYSYHRGRKAIA